ncbi:transcriptional regulator [Paenibacillus sp. J31TS4]|uniref:ArsR/SmtB family transcription factor n=1 Tax=Paenibacillus sp. J31TS4 TaxID=2807195 RepID=UPI001B0F196A|nr:ArsR family transcriptional regulator [Paenibacillus sp. J31TS4]GIP41124.1 transcriptional regulator [Paenibacillus sp. J31TS4]
MTQKQKQCMIVETYEQLKALSDPFRAQIIMLLIEKAYTGQQLSQQLEIPRSKIHYHLNELEKNGLIFVAKTEAKNGILQKFYRSSARGYTPSAKLLPYGSEVVDYYRESTINGLNRARMRAISAPEEAFAVENADRSSWPRINMQIEFQMKREKYVEWLGRYRELLNELGQEEDPDGEWFYMTTVGFQIDEPWFDEEGMECESLDKALESLGRPSAGKPPEKGQAEGGTGESAD